jgi:hypothetical protein
VAAVKAACEIPEGVFAAGRFGPGPVMAISPERRICGRLPDMADGNGSLYDEDFYAWTQEQAELLRRVRPGDNRLDTELIAEEIEDLGKSELHACQSLCEHIIEHLLKLEFSGLAEPADHWRDEIVEWRLQLQRKMTRSILAKMDVEERYRYALRLLRRLERDVPGLMSRVPTECPYSFDQILSGGEEDWFPSAG